MLQNCFKCTKYFAYNTWKVNIVFRQRSFVVKWYWDCYDILFWLNLSCVFNFLRNQDFLLIGINLLELLLKYIVTHIVRSWTTSPFSTRACILCIDTKKGKKVVAYQDLCYFTKFRNDFEITLHNVFNTKNTCITVGLIISGKKIKFR